jgi:hypothetical protein
MIARGWLPFAAVCVLAVATPAAGQSVSDVLTFLLTNQSVSTGSVERDVTAAEATSATISRALLASLATLPVATSSGGFVYRLNPELGTVERATESFGPFFVERAQTAGRGQASFGVTFQQLRLGSLDGRNLRDGSLVTTANQFADEAAPFDVDQLTLDIDASIATFYGNVGVSDRMEIGFAAPVVSLQVDGTRLNRYRGQSFTQATGSARAFGLADLVIRAKYVVSRRADSGLAAAVDVRAPTGRQQDLLGAGSAAVKLSAIASVERGRFSMHGNGGVAFGGLAREASYDAAMAVATSSRVTAVGELLGRRIETPGHILSVAAPHPTLLGVETIRLLPDASTLDILTFAPGLKWNVRNTWVLAANVSIPLTSAGLTAGITPFVGLDYALGR